MWPGSATQKINLLLSENAEGWVEERAPVSGAIGRVVLSDIFKRRRIFTRDTHTCLCLEPQLPEICPQPGKRLCVMEMEHTCLWWLPGTKSNGVKHPPSQGHTLYQESTNARSTPHLCLDSNPPSFLEGCLLPSPRWDVPERLWPHSFPSQVRTKDQSPPARR